MQLRLLKNKLFGLAVILNLLDPSDGYYGIIESKIKKTLSEISEITGETEIRVELPT